MLMNQSVLQKDKEIGRSVKYTIQRLTDDIFFPNSDLVKYNGKSSYIE
jgi:hypothetical protein